MKQLNPSQAQALLTQAEQTSATVKAGASWAQIATLLTLGAASTLGFIAIAFATRLETEWLWLPMSALLLWVGLSIVFGAVFGRSAKRGFSRRWFIYLGLWAAAWTFGVIGVTTFFVGNLVFVALLAVLLTAITVGGAWFEASR